MEVRPGRCRESESLQPCGYIVCLRGLPCCAVQNRGRPHPNRRSLPHSYTEDKAPGDSAALIIVAASAGFLGATTGISSAREIIYNMITPLREGSNRVTSLICHVGDLARSRLYHDHGLLCRSTRKCCQCGLRQSLSPFPYSI
jgi:hypothetical protein